MTDPISNFCQAILHEDIASQWPGRYISEVIRAWDTYDEDNNDVMMSYGFICRFDNGKFAYIHGWDDEHGFIEGATITISDQLESLDVPSYYEWHEIVDDLNAFIRHKRSQNDYRDRSNLSSNTGAEARITK